MRTKFATVALATAVAIGAGIAIPPGADAQPNPEAREERLQMMIDDGIITEERADEIRARIAERAERLAERQAQRMVRLDDLATTLGTTADELKADLRAGTSLADIATAAGVDVETIIDKFVADMTDRINQAVNDGHIDQEHADTKLEALRERVTARVNGERPELPEGRRPFRRGPLRPGGN